jgi:hypothetical protein
MKKLFVILFFSMILSSCYLKSREGKPQEVNGTTEDFNVVFLFECNGVEIYRFYDSGHARYFAIGNGSVMTKQSRTYGSGKTTRTEYWDDSVIK